MIALLGAVALLCAGLIVYSQTWAFTWDEGFHLLAAQLIDAGKRPYLDFCFPQTPLNAYWNAAWMRVFGQSWRVPHAVSAVMVAGSVWLIAGFVFSRFPISRWRLAAALTAVSAAGLNAVVVEYGTLGQAYGTCLFLSVAAFRLTIRAATRKSLLHAAAAGCCAGAAAASSMLTVAAIPPLLLWLCVYNNNGNRWMKSAAFSAAVAIPFAPVLWLFVQAPRIVLFNVFEYQLFFRKLYWPDPGQHDLEVVTSWIDSGQALLLILLAVAGLLYVLFRGGWERRVRAEFYLAAWLAIAIAAELCMGHPTFARYFLLTVPFVAVLASVGLYAASTSLERPFWPVLLLTLLFALGLGKSIYERFELYTWSDYEEIARKVAEVTPPGAPLYANEPIYFLTRRTPPVSMEFFYSHKLDLPAPLAASLHIVPEKEMNRRVASGYFATTYSCDDDFIKEMRLAEIYKQHAEVQGCDVFWDNRDGIRHATSIR